MRRRDRQIAHRTERHHSAAANRDRVRGDGAQHFSRSEKVTVAGFVVAQHLDDDGVLAVDAGQRR